MWWSIMPLVSQTENESGRNIEYREAMYGAVRVVAEKRSGEGWRVSRVISTEPEDYLRSELYPGQLIDETFVFELCK